MAGCTGACCEKFWLPYTKEGFQQLADGGKTLNGSRQEAQKIADMIIPLGFELNDKGRLAYTCKWWDKGTRLCTNYQDRPNVCRDHPVLEPCNLDKTGKCTEATTCKLLRGDLVKIEPR